MGVQNRGSYTGPRSRRSGGQNSIIRSMGIMLGLGLASFALGFFILSPLLRQSANNTANNGAIPATNGDTNNSLHPAHPVPLPRDHIKRSASPAVSPSQSNSPGPTIEPVEEQVQKPSLLDGDGKLPEKSQKPEDNAASLNAIKPDETKRQENSPPSERRQNQEEKPTDVQTPGSLDETASGAAPPEKHRTETTKPPETAPAASTASGLFRVQTGAYSTNSAAEEEAKKVRDKGFSATVQQFQREGKTLYRVQTGVFRNRVNAEANRQKLTEAGFDVTISNG